MSAGQTGQMTGQTGHVPGTDGTQTRGCPAKIPHALLVFFSPQCRVAEKKTARRRTSWTMFASQS